MKKSITQMFDESLKKTFEEACLEETETNIDALLTCQFCGAGFVHIIDPKTKKEDPYTYKAACEHYPDLFLSVG